MRMPAPGAAPASNMLFSSASPTTVSGMSSPRFLMFRISSLLSSREDLRRRVRRTKLEEEFNLCPSGLTEAAARQGRARVGHPHF